MTRTSSATGPSPAGGGPALSLTDRQLEVLRRVAQGEELRSIGADLHLSVGGVHALLFRTFPKLGAANTVNAVHIAGRMGLLGDRHAPEACPGSVRMPETLVCVLRLVACGHTNAEIGRHFERSEGWAAEQMRAIMRRLDARDRAHAVALAIGAGLIRPPRPEQHAA